MLKRVREIILVFGDIALALAALFLTVRIGFWESFNWLIFYKHFFPFIFLYFFWFLLFYIFGLYDLDLIRPKLEFLARTGECFLACLGLGIGFFYLIPFFGITPKTNLLINILIFGGLFSIWRRSFYYIFSSLFLERVAFLGKNSLSQKLANQIKKNPQLGYKMIGFLDPRKNIFSQVKRKRIETLIIARELNGKSKLTRDLYKCLLLKINFLDLAKAYEILFQKIPIDFVSQTWFLENLAEGEKKIYDKLKRAGDVILAILMIIVSSPLWLIFSWLIKLEDKGPVFYTQKRVGKDRKEFFLWKFRSMKVGAEKEGGAKWAEKDDPRVTKIGKILRKIHLDELPQMINVLKGDISLVGPRPERPEFVKKLEKEIPHYHLRHIIKPGFTGWAQIKFRYARSLMDSHEKFQYDLYYIKNRSLTLDLGILLKTFQLLFKSE